jgi:C_GCAxxG_C_C family probable redox protein
MSSPDFDFEEALKRALERIDIGPHCSCADITMEILREHLALQGPAVRHAASGFGGGVGGSGGPCGAFSAGLIALALAYAQKAEPRGCIAEPIEADVQAYWDAWTHAYGSIMCPDLSGYPSLRDEAAREDFAQSGGPDRCTERYIRFAVETVVESAAASRTS